MQSTPRAQSHGTIIWNENLEVFVCFNLSKQKYNSKSGNDTDISYIQIKVLVADVKAQGYCFPCWIWPASWFILALQILIEVNLRQHALPSFYFAGGAGLALRINHKLLHDRLFDSEMFIKFMVDS